MFGLISCVKGEIKLGCSLSRTKKSILVESRDRIPTRLRAKNIYLHPKIYPEQRQSSTTKKVVRTEPVQEEELIPPRVPSPRAGTSASFRSIERIREPNQVQIIPQPTSRKGKAWVRPPIVKEVILLSKLSEEDVSSENEYVGPIHKVEFFYVKKDLHLSKEAK